MSITIAKALKEKNRITGKINLLQQQLYKFNTYQKDKAPDLNPADLMKSLQEEWAYLIDLKTKIAKANVGIAEKLIRLTEAKAELKFWTNFRSGPAEDIETIFTYDYTLQQNFPTIVTNVSVYPSKQVLENQSRVQTLIETLQDEIDDFNALTRI